MKILVNNKLLIEHGELCASLWNKTKGLMFRKINNNQALIMKFNKKKNLRFHNCFVPQTLQLVGVINNKVVEIKKLKPWRMVTMKKRAEYIIEMLPNKKIKINDYISFNY